MHEIALLWRGPFSPRLLNAHVPLDQAANLPLSVATRYHSLDELRVFFLAFAVLLGPEADHRQKLLHLAEHASFDDFADLLVAGPGRVFAVVVGACPQTELHHLVAEL